ncbi:AraC family transcriptional regulator [Nocardia huaxiensis]|uniref:AraC family transcriptional regulator n=1 Tax=Nocardia huaxiensis TaxID=2755382 RepID=A0A7D6VKY2_9NOCA|nr:AraC family transcriptional regulator [Nocardia huaxiensis]QLY31890.1 AraC family transcriptional regulator [Nocardia huaxiensis]
MSAREETCPPGERSNAEAVRQRGGGAAFQGVRQLEVRAGEGLREAETFGAWEAAMVETYFPLAVSPLAEAPTPSSGFHGSLAHGRYGAVDVTVVGATPQRVRLTDSLIAAAPDEFLLASICTRGRGRLRLGDRVAEIGPGEMVFFPSNRKLHWDFGERWEKTVLQVPVDVLRERSGCTLDQVRTGLTLPRQGAIGVVSRFFTNLADLQRHKPDEAALLANSALDLLTTAVRLSAGEILTERSALAFARERVHEFIRAHCADPGLTVDRIAEGCMMSRRSLYRVFDEMADGPGTLLRRLRIERAAGLLAESALPIAVVATASGFSSESHFYRAFRHEMGTTPAAFRARPAQPE